MKFAILSLAAAGALALTSGSAQAHPPGYGPSFYRGGGFGGPSFYRGGFYNPGWSGTNITIGTPRGFGINIGSGGFYNPGWNRSYYGGWNRPYYGGWGGGYRPYYGGYGRGWGW